MAMQIPKPSAADRARFEELIPADPRVEVKPMFGNLGAFVNGNMFAGLFGSAIGLKLPEVDRDSLSAEGGGPFGPIERPMGGYVTIPSALLDDPARSSAFVAKAMAYVAGLPAKVKGPAKKAAKRA